MWCRVPVLVPTVGSSVFIGERGNVFPRLIRLVGVRKGANGGRLGLNRKAGIGTVRVLTSRLSPGARLMLDLPTFLTELYVIIDDWDKTQPPEPRRPGPVPQLSRSEVLTIAVLGQWGRFASERDYFRWAECHLPPFFPRLPSRVQFSIAQRRLSRRLEQVAIWLGQQPTAPNTPFEILDATGLATRDCKRRGAGWLPQAAAVGQCTRLGWYEGVRLLVCRSPIGAITGYGLAPANTNDRRLADTLLAVRHLPHPDLPSAGTATTDRYLADKGFTGRMWEAHWARDYQATVLCPPERDHRRHWSRGQRRRHAGRRQIIETVMDKLLNGFRLCRERPHQLAGLQARVAAKIALHNACLLLNQRAGRRPLAFAGLIDW